MPVRNRTVVAGTGTERKGATTRNLVVTGAAGFIGYHACEALLQRGYRVVGVDNLSDCYDPKLKSRRVAALKKNVRFTFKKVSVADFKKFSKVVAEAKPIAIVHLAAQAGVRYSIENPWAYAESNYLGTLNVFEAAREHKVRRVLAASTSSVYGDNEKQPFGEADRTDTPISIYAATKKANEVLGYSYHVLHGLEVGFMRFFTVYGRMGRPDMALFKFAKRILTGRSIDVYNRGDMARSFTHVSDVVGGIVALLEKNNLAYEIYNFGGDRAVPLMDFIRALERSLGKKAKLKFLPMQRGDVKETVADTTKARRDLGYAPKVSVEEGIDDFAQWFLENQSWLAKLKEPKQ